MGGKLSSLFQRNRHEGNEDTTTVHTDNEQNPIKEQDATEDEQREQEQIQKELTKDLNKNESLTLKIKYDQQNVKKLNLSNQGIQNDDHFYEALLQHKCPQLVKHLLLCGSSMVTQVPVLIGMFENLNVLDLHDNGIVDIPWSFIYLTHLTELNLSSNQLKQIPPIIGHLENLEILNLSQNCLITIPTELLKLQKLTNLDLTANTRLLGVTKDQCKKGVKEIFGILRLRSERRDLWADSKPWINCSEAVAYINSVPSLLSIAVQSILTHKVNFLMMETVPTTVKTYLSHCAVDYSNHIKIGKCNKCLYFYSTKELFDNHVCRRNVNT